MIEGLQKIITHEALTFKQKFAYIEILVTAINSIFPKSENVLEPNPEVQCKLILMVFQNF